MWKIGRFTWLCLIVIHLLVNTEAKNERFKRFISKLKRQVTTSECHNFEWSISSITKYYSCCNEENLQNGSTCTNRLNSTSSNFECNPFGKEIYKKNTTSEFNCGRCEGKKWAMEKCNSRWKLAGIDTTDGCWIWSACFKGACDAQEAAYLDEDKSVPQETNFCGDGFCIKSTGETVDNCPIDCCPEVNSACSVTSEKCTEPCCNESGCCITSSSIIYIAIICGVVVLINLICCCCCFCCYRKIKLACGFTKKLKPSISLDNLSQRHPSPKSLGSKNHSPAASLGRKGSPQSSLGYKSSPKSLGSKNHSPASTLGRKASPQANLEYKSNSLASLNKKVYYVSRGDYSPRPSKKSSSLTSLNTKGLSRSTQSIDRINF
ncbi:uncharacterized protein LOC117102429 [Anneissia japonica]|uniref:uncharacterized protein LOC117102429 n=1 Tax=Anneissia japonica TaxID=1529436 RepID=UPI001425A997|nr:uncharacterized protein LOC117102429 [Anneissia japonica]